ncbi:MAG: hypothetical protein CVU20_10915 [Betaproteobacteria bacterium HGW-Betaproteobacteria-14]|nr:MAG: hypothetical protein CVU20_10915 [Betaproteobacteria bacterium HGW-Betaproteobacteria-14]
MKTYVVGGAVRDRLLGLPVQDRDHVVVGASPEEMLARGFKPVGRDFPVFLHPDTHEEYALARTERKTAPGYAGFAFHAAPDVTLEEDLARRDLTVNAIAEDENGALVDPFGGQADLAAREHGVIHGAAALRPATLVKLLERTDALRRPERFAQLLLACECDYRGRPGREDKPWPAADILRSALVAVQAVDAGAIAAATTDKAQIPQRIHEARVAAVKQVSPSCGD